MSITPPLPLEIAVDDEIVLRRYFDTPLEVLHALIHRNIEHLGRFLPWAKSDYSLGGVKEFLETARQRWGEGGDHGYAVFYNDELAGAVGVKGFESPVRAVSLGYWLSSHMEGRGIMTRSVDALIRLAFDTYGMNQAVIRAVPHNRRSRAIPERLGFIQTGTDRQMAMNATGELFDLVNYSLLRSEWQARSD